MKHLRQILRLTLILTTVLVVLQWAFFSRGPFTWAQLMEAIGINVLFTFVLAAANYQFFEFISARFDWETRPKPRLWFGALGSIVLTMSLFALLRILVWTTFYGKSLPEYWVSENRQPYLIALLVTVIVSLFLHAFYFYKALQEKKVKAHKIVAGTASARFDALKSQLDPHFLFNSLNVLTSLIEEDPHQAQRFTTSLSKVYRYVLEQKDKDLVPISEELDFARTYVRLLQMRFEEGIVCDMPETPSDPEVKIVPLSLQLALENAVKHNVVSPSRPLHISVYEEQGGVVVANTLQEKQITRESSGVGLKNISERYALFTDQAVRAEKAQGLFKVFLPLLPAHTTVHRPQKAHIMEKRYQKAKERVDMIKGFYGNMMSYVLVIPFLWWLNTETTSFLWAIFPTVGWGFGLIAHGVVAFGGHRLWGKAWEDRKIRELMERDDF